MKIALAQLNPTVGDLNGNANAIGKALAQAEQIGAELLITSELAITGYPPKDLLDDPNFIRDVFSIQRKLSQKTSSIPLVLGGIASEQANPLDIGSKLYNAALVLASGQVKACHRKILLPNYDVFDEARYFSHGEEITIFTYKSEKIAITI